MEAVKKIAAAVYGICAINMALGGFKPTHYPNSLNRLIGNLMRQNLMR